MVLMAATIADALSSGCKHHGDYRLLQSPAVVLVVVVVVVVVLLQQREDKQTNGVGRMQMSEDK